MRMSGPVVADTPVPWEPERTGPVTSADPLVALHAVGDDGLLRTACRVVGGD